MGNEELSVINLEDYRKRESTNKIIEKNEGNSRTLDDSFYDELRKEKRKEKGFKWD